VASLRAIPAVTTNVTVACYVRLSVRMSHSCTLLKPLDGMRCHLAGTSCGPKSHCIRREPWYPHSKGRFEGQNPWFAAVQPIAKLLWPLLSVLYC